MAQHDELAKRARWKGSISLGELAFPVRLFLAETSDKPKLHFMHDKDGSQVDRVYRCVHEDADIPYAELVRAVEGNSGTYLPLTQNDLDLAAAGKSKVIEIKQFTDADSIDFFYYEKPYYIVADKGGERAYALLREVLARVHKIAIAKFLINFIQPAVYTFF